MAPALLAAGLLACAPPAGPRPDVILVTLDTTRADRVSAIDPDSPVSTAAIDALAADGLAFLDATTVAPLTAPAHASILTGLLPARHGIRDNGRDALADGVGTLAAWLGAAGWRTGGFVGAAVLSSRTGLDRGFEVYDDHIERDSGRSFVIASRDGAEVVAAALAWAESLPGRAPAMAWVHLFDPHAPYTPPEPERSRHPGAPYDGEIAYADRLVGELLDGWAARRPERPRLVAVVADHGEGLGEHGEPSHGVLLHTATLAVPLVLAGPGVPEGRRVAARVSVVDLAPTLARLCGVAPPDDLDGRDLVAVAEGVAGPAPAWAETIYPLHSYGWTPLRAVRDGPLELVVGARAELFDLARDPGETRDLAAGRPAEVRRLRALLDRGVPPFDEAATAPALDPETRARLEALGYVGRASAPVAEGPRPDPRDRVGLLPELEEAVALADAGRIEEAVGLLRSVLERDPGNPVAATRIGVLERRRGDHAAALAAFELAARLDPTDPWSRAQVARSLLDLGRPAEAADRLEAAVAEGVDGLELRLVLAEAALRAGRTDRAREALEAAEGLLPPSWRTARPHPGPVPDPSRAWDAEVAARCGDLAWAAGAPDVAALAWDLTGRIVPTDPRPHYNRALALERLGRAAEARAALEDALAADPGFEPARRRLAPAPSP